MATYEIGSSMDSSSSVPASEDLPKTRFDTEVGAKFDGPLVLGPLRYDDPMPPGITCECVFRAHHSLRGVPQNDAEALHAVIMDKLCDPAVEQVVATHELSEDEGFAIAWYALNLYMANPNQDRNNVWRVANELLRARKMDELQDLQLVPWLRFLLKGLLKLPVWQGKTYRGVSVPLVKISSSYVPQKEVTWTALSSTTVDPAGTMRKFGHGHEGITTTSRWGNLCAA
eukprot:RCo007748